MGPKYTSSRLEFSMRMAKFYRHKCIERPYLLVK